MWFWPQSRGGPLLTGLVSDIITKKGALSQPINWQDVYIDNNVVFGPNHGVAHYLRD